MCTKKFPTVQQIIKHMQVWSISSCPQNIICLCFTRCCTSKLMCSN